MDTTFKESAFTPKLGEVRPIDISSHGRRDLHEKTVADLVETLRRDGRFLHPIAVRNGDTQHRLLAGHHRVEASKRCFGDQAPIPAIIFPSDTPDALIAILEIEENLLRKELTAEERERQTILLAAALKRLNGGQPVTPISASGEAAETGNLIPSLAPARGGRGNKGTAQRVAEKLGIGKRAVNMRRKSAAAVIGEEIDLDRDTPEELERKAAKLERIADKRQRAEPKVVRRKRRKTEPRGVVEDATPPAEPHAGEIDSEIEEVWRGFSALSERKQLAIMLRASRLRGWALRMGRARRVPAVDEEPAVALSLKAAPATYDTAVDSQPEQQEDGADVSADDLQHPGSAVSQAAGQEPELAVDLPAEVAPATNVAVDSLEEQRDDAADLGAEDLPLADHASKGADDPSHDVHDDAAEDSDGHAFDDDVSAAADDHDSAGDVSEHACQEDLGAQDLQDAGDGVSEAVNQEPGGAMKCAYCGVGFSSTDPSGMQYGRFYHRQVCVKYAKPIAIAAE